MLDMISESWSCVGVYIYGTQDQHDAMLTYIMENYNISDSEDLSNNINDFLYM